MYSLLFETTKKAIYYYDFALVIHGIVRKVRYSTVSYCTVYYRTVHYSTVQHSTVQYSIVQNSTKQYKTVQHSTAQHSTRQHSTAQYKPFISRRSLQDLFSILVKKVDLRESIFYKRTSLVQHGMEIFLAGPSFQIMSCIMNTLEWNFLSGLIR